MESQPPTRTDDHSARIVGVTIGPWRTADGINIVAGLEHPMVDHSVIAMLNEMRQR